MEDKIFSPRVKRIPIPAGGRIDSKDLGSFVDSTVSDVVDASRHLSALSKKIDSDALTYQLEMSNLWGAIQELKDELNARKLSEADGGFLSTFAASVSDPKSVSFLNASDNSNRVSVNTQFGEATVPFNGVQHRFYYENIRSRSLIPVSNLQLEVTGTFDLNDGNGLIDHEYGGTITAGSPEYAFNGNNSKRWTRRVEFEMESDVSEIYTEITATIPRQASSQANCIYISPFPDGSVDVVGVYVSPDLSNSFTIIPNFEVEEGVFAKRWFFPTQSVQRVKIRLRQRRWVEENGRKVFYLGAQEIGLQLIEFDKTYNPAGDPEDNHSMVLKLKAPDGYGFQTITGLWSDPMFNLEDAGSRHVHIKLDLAGDGSNVIWDSDLDDLPQNQVGGISVGSVAEYVYAIVTLNYVSSSGGVTSPFLVGTTPVFRSVSLQAQTISR